MAKAVHSMIRVLDEARSVDFYARALGLAVADRLDFDGFTLIYLTGAPAPADNLYIGAMVGQLEDASGSGAGRYPLSWQVSFVSGGSPRFEIRPSSAASELVYNSPVVLTTSDFIVLQFSYITAEPVVAP